MRKILCFILSIILIMTSTIVPSETLAAETVIKNYEYIGDVQTFTAPHTGTYVLEVWGHKVEWYIIRTRVEKVAMQKGQLH